MIFKVVFVHIFVERGGHVAYGEANDGCSVSASKGHAEESSVCGHADGFCSTGPAIPGEQVKQSGNTKQAIKFTF